MTAEVHDISRGRGTKAQVGPSPMPLSIESEQAVLGTLMMHNESVGVICSNVSADDFAEEIHRRTFLVAVDLIGSGQPATPATIKVFLGDDEIAEGVTVSAYLARLCASAMPVYVAPEYATFIRNLSYRRRLIQQAGELDDRARNAEVTEEPATIAAEFILALQAIASASGTDTTRHIAEYADSLVELADSVRSGEVRHEAVTTGYRDLDQATNGYEPGTLWVTAGRPGMGKSMMVNSSAVRTAKTGVGVLEFPLEIGPQQAVARHLADIAYRSGNPTAFRDIGRRAKELTETDMVAVRTAQLRLRSMPIEIDDRSTITVAQIGAKVAQTKRAMAARGTRLGVVFIDHLDFIKASDRYSGNRTQEIGEICIGLKHIARSQDVCVNLLCQLSREVEKRQTKDRRPGLSDLRNSGDLEQVADVAMFLYREEYYLLRSPEYLAGDPEAAEAAINAAGKLEAILGKVRAGPTPTVHLFCSPASSSISSFERGRA